MLVAPDISVLMTVYNGERYLRESIDSILGQDFPDFEFLIVDDGSTDSSIAIVASYSDSRIVHIKADHLGLVGALNLGLSHVKGHFIARMDADDRARPTRLRVQRDYFAKNPDVDLVCSDIATIDDNGRLTGYQRQAHADNTRFLKGLTFERNDKPIIHPSVMMRAGVPRAIGGYRAFDCAEDRDFWLRAIEQFKFARVAEILLEYRMHAGGISRTKGAKQATASVMSVVNYKLRKILGVDLFETEPSLFKDLYCRAHEHLEATVIKPSTAFRTARLDVLNGKHLDGWIGLALTFLRHGPRCLPNNSAKETLKIVEKIVTEAPEHLTASSKMNLS